MKYTILGFQQTKLIENGLKVDDALILRVIKDMYSSASMEFKDFDGIKYMWINYTYLLEQLPIVGSKRNLMRKIEQYGKDMFLLRVLENSRNGIKGNFSYISPTCKLDEMQDFDLMTKSHKGYDKIAQGLGQNRISLVTESHNKDTSIKDTSIKDNKDIVKNNKNVPVKINYAEFVNMTETEYNKLVTEHGEAKTKKMIEILDNYKGSNNKKYASDYRAILSWVIDKVSNVKTDTKSQYKIV